MNEGTLVHNGRFFHHFYHPFLSFFPPQLRPYPVYLRRLSNVGLQVSSSDADLCDAKPGTKCWRTSRSHGACSFGTESQISGLESDGSLYIQTLKNFPVEELLGKTVLVRFDSAILLGEATHANTHSLYNACYTIRYLYDAGSKVLLVSSWEVSNARLALTHSVADYLSSVLLLKVRPVKSETKEVQKADILLLENLTDIQEELANSSVLAKKLSSGIDIFVNDAISISHKILASTVGVTQFSCASMAGFYFEAELSQLMQLKNPTKQPYIVIKVLWIGSEGFDLSMQQIHGASNLALMLEKIRRTGCDITVVGSAACNAVLKTSGSLSAYNVLEKASVVWELLKGKTLPAVAALDRAYPFEVEWSAVFYDPTQPLVVDIGSGNGLFLLGMARIWRHSNFLGLEINKKLVKQCLKSVLQDKLKNVHFFSTNATSTFRSILSSYPGDVVLVSIQCPNPDFNHREHRWRMLQRGLVEAITDLLITDGKVFLQSDIEEVSTRMKEQFLTYGKGKFAITTYKDIEYDKEGWLKENPLGVRSDWEQHVLDRGAPMYRLMISKVKK